MDNRGDAFRGLPIFQRPAFDWNNQGNGDNLDHAPALLAGAPQNQLNFLGNVNNVENDQIEGAEVEKIQEVESVDLQPELSRRRKREEDGEDEGTRSKRFRWWDEFDDTDSESDSLSDTEDDDEDDVVAEVEVSHQVSQADEGVLPGSSTKRQREDDEELDHQSSKRFRLWNEASEKQNNPSGSKKRKRDEDEDEDEDEEDNSRSPKHFRLK